MMVRGVRRGSVRRGTMEGELMVRGVGARKVRE